MKTYSVLEGDAAFLGYQILTDLSKGFDLLLLGECLKVSVSGEEEHQQELLARQTWVTLQIAHKILLGCGGGKVRSREGGGREGGKEGREREGRGKAWG